MESIPGRSPSLQSFRCVVVAGVAVVGISACATSGISSNAYKLVLNAPGLETVQPEVVVLDEDYSSIVEQSTWKAADNLWPQAELRFWRIKDHFRNQKSYTYQYSLPELARHFLPGEWIQFSTLGKSKNVLGDLEYQRFRWKFDSECVFIRQGVSRFADQVELRGTEKPLGDMVIMGWYCVGPSEKNQYAAIQGFIKSLGIQGYALP